MKNLFISLIAALTLFSTSAFAVDKCFTGSWVNSDVERSGLDIQVLDNINLVAGYFYTWRGTERTMFNIVGANDSDTEVTLRGYQSLYDWTPAVGQATIDVIDNDTIIYSWNWVNDFTNVDNTMRWCLHGGCSGVIEYTRLTQPIPCE